MNYPKLPSFRLDGKRALITGAGRGIGMGASIALAESGADVTLVSRTETELKDLTKHINNQGYKSSYEVLDVSDEDEVSLPLIMNGGKFGKADDSAIDEFMNEQESGRDINFVYSKTPNGTHRVMASIS